MILLEDDLVLHFINHGYLTFRPYFAPALLDQICSSLTALNVNPGNHLLQEVPELFEVLEQPDVKRFLVSLMGPDVTPHPHRHFYNSAPGSPSQGWHVDAASPDHMLKSIILFFLPHGVDLEMGPTVFLPGSHFRRAPMDQLSNYGNVRGQIYFTGAAGTVALLHPDLWHARSLNRSPRHRHMIKFMLTRPESPLQPSWNHDPVSSERLFLTKCREFVGPVKGFCSDYLSEWEWRRRLWNWMRGAPAQAPNLMDFLV